MRNTRGSFAGGLLACILAITACHDAARNKQWDNMGYADNDAYYTPPIGMCLDDAPGC
jgi:hypothetical protein